jgi:pyridoxal phosphate enzyme (YggS family)
MTTIEERLQGVHQRIAQACARAGRDPGGVALLAVSKTFDAHVVRQAHAAGQRVFGENYIQEAVEKMALLEGLDIEWHCIGTVQRNKTRLVALHFDWAHTIDRFKTAERLGAQRPPGRAPLQVCIQVNVDGGANKSGVPPEQALELARAVAALPGLDLRGLMAIPEPSEDYNAQLAQHRRAADVFQAIGAAGLPGLRRWDTLSLGMSADLEAAVMAGSTMVRVGTAIFGGRGQAG